MSDRDKPMEVLNVREVGFCVAFECPRCEKTLNYDDDGNKINYCYICGQRLDVGRN